jgi:hypothetical protein
MPLHRSSALVAVLALALAPFAAAQPAMIAKPARESLRPPATM